MLVPGATCSPAAGDVPTTLPTAVVRWRPAWPAPDWYWISGALPSPAAASRARAWSGVVPATLGTTMTAPVIDAGGATLSDGVALVASAGGLWSRLTSGVLLLIVG